MLFDATSVLGSAPPVAAPAPVRPPQQQPGADLLATAAAAPAPASAPIDKPAPGDTPPGMRFARLIAQSMPALDTGATVLDFPHLT
jgi:hypothetical protein